MEVILLEIMYMEFPQFNRTNEYNFFCLPHIHACQYFIGIHWTFPIRVALTAPVTTKGSVKKLS